jgi:hypothetical protein
VFFLNTTRIAVDVQQYLLAGKVGVPAFRATIEFPYMSGYHGITSHQPQWFAQPYTCLNLHSAMFARDVHLLLHLRLHSRHLVLRARRRLLRAHDNGAQDLCWRAQPALGPHPHASRSSCIGRARCDHQLGVVTRIAGLTCRRLLRRGRRSSTLRLTRN